MGLCPASFRPSVHPTEYWYKSLSQDLATSFSVRMCFMCISLGVFLIFSISPSKQVLQAKVHFSMYSYGRRKCLYFTQYLYFTNSALTVDSPCQDLSPHTNTLTLNPLSRSWQSNTFLNLKKFLGVHFFVSIVINKILHGFCLASINLKYISTTSDFCDP